MRQLMVIAALAVAGLGCDEGGIEGSCADFCSDVAACFGGLASGAELDECESECIASFGELPAECEDPLGQVLTCTSDALCSGEQFDINACGNIEIPAACEAVLEDSGDCCTEANNCDWANDGVCDCDGQFAWDAADCGG